MWLREQGIELASELYGCQHPSSSTEAHALRLTPRSSLLRLSNSSNDKYDKMRSTSSIGVVVNGLYVLVGVICSIRRRLSSDATHSNGVVCVDASVVRCETGRSIAVVQKRWSRCLGCDDGGVLNKDVGTICERGREGGLLCAATVAE